MVVINKKNSEKINPATEEKQDAIIAALGGIPTNDNANIDDLIAEIDLLKGKLTDHSQLTQVVKSDGTPVDFSAEFTALKAKFADATQKTKLISDTGVVVDLVAEFTALKAKFADATQKTKLISDTGVVVDLVAEFTALKAKFADATQKTKLISDTGVVVDLVAEFTALKAKFTDATQKTQLVDAAGLNVYPSGKPIILTGTLTLPNNASSYAAGDAVNDSAASPTAMAFDVDAALANGGGGVIGLIKIMAASQFAGKTINVAIYKDTPTSIVGDNGAFVIDSANNARRIAIIPVLMDAILGSSTICYGQASVFNPYQTIAAGKTLKALLFTSDAVTSPTVSSTVTVMLTTVQIA